MRFAGYARWVRKVVQELRALTREHGYPHWSALVPIYDGQLQLTRGEARAAVTLIARVLTPIA